jgi:ribosome-associated protein
MTSGEQRQQVRFQVQAAAQACEDKKGEDTRILELDPIDAALADFFLITSATNDRQVQAIADEIEFRLKQEFGVYAHSVEGRRQAEWILLDYVDFVVHVFLAEKRAYYDIERLRKSARPLTPAEFDAELTAELSRKTLAARKKTAPKKAAPKKKAAAKKAVAKKPVVAKKTATKKTAAKKAVAKKAVAKKAPAKKAVGKKTTAKKVVVKKSPAKKMVVKKAAAAKNTVVKKPAAKKVVGKKSATKKVGTKKAASRKAVKTPVKKAVAKKKTVKRR